ncbi:MAG: MBL fold metallo-hydrolase [Acidobacteria bacterium]|nr:MBL fold metallo-hydrolase [Acidobacteriota bacterium]
MATRLLTASALLALVVGGVGAQDARAVLQAVAKNIGADNLTSMQISGTGWNAAPGQSYTPADDWPKFEITSYTKAIDFGARFAREQVTRRQGNYPPRGGGGTPLQGEQRLDLLVNGTVAWNMQGTMPQPIVRGYLDGIPVAEQRQLDIIMTPHGFVKAAMAQGANPTVVTSMPRGRQVTTVSITALGKYRVAATINDRNEIEFVQTRVANPVFGDMLYETRYGPYKQFGSVKFPSVIHHHQGDDRLNPGHNTMDIQVSAVQANAPVQVVAAPDAAKAPAPPVSRVESQKLAEGVWFIGGGSHNSMAVEFRDFVTVVEGPLNEERGLAVIAETRKLIPKKPIRYLVNTHHHFDHSGGMRPFVAEGAAIVTHQMNREFYETVHFSPWPRTLQADRLFLLNPDQVRDPVFELVNQKYVISDGTRTLDVHPVQGLNHAGTMLVAHLPRERILVNADLYSPPAQGAPLPMPNPNMRALQQTIQRLRLDVAQHVPIHGRVGTHDEFVKIVGQPATN